MPNRYCAKNPPITSADSKVGKRSQGEAEIAIEQGETRCEGVTGPRAAKYAAKLIPLPELARRGRRRSHRRHQTGCRRGCSTDSSDRTGSIRLDQAASREQSADAHQITRLRTSDKSATQVNCASTPVCPEPHTRSALRVIHAVRNFEGLVDASV